MFSDMVSDETQTKGPVLDYKTEDVLLDCLFAQASVQGNTSSCQAMLKRQRVGWEGQTQHIM